MKLIIVIALATMMFGCQKKEMETKDSTIHNTYVTTPSPTEGQNSDKVISGAENPDVNCVDQNGKTLTKQDALYDQCLKEMKNAK